MKYESMNDEQIKQLFVSGHVDKKLLDYCKYSHSSQIRNLANEYIKNNTEIPKRLKNSDVKSNNDDISSKEKTNNKSIEQKQEKSTSFHFIRLLSIFIPLIVIFSIIWFINKTENKSSNSSDNNITKEEKTNNKDSIDNSKEKLINNKKSESKKDNSYHASSQEKKMDEDNRKKQEEDEKDIVSDDSSPLNVEILNIPKIKGEKWSNNTSDKLEDDNDKDDYFRKQGEGYYYCDESCVKWKGQRLDFIDYLVNAANSKNKNFFKNKIIKFKDGGEIKIDIEEYKD